MNEKKKRISFRSILNVLLCAILIPIILINLVLILRGYMHPEELPGIFGIKPAVVLSGSMEPTIKIGDLILVHSVDSASLKKGDVVCYLYSGTCLHVFASGHLYVPSASRPPTRKTGNVVNLRVFVKKSCMLIK